MASSTAFRLWPLTLYFQILPSASQDNYSCPINHTAGNHELRAKHIIEKTQARKFDSQDAIGMLMLHRLYTIDCGSTRAGSKPAALEDEYHPVFFLDYTSTIVRPLIPITRTSDRFFDNVTISFQHWRTPYSAKHLYDLLFHLERRIVPPI